jgi:hypothetical protein
MVKFESNSDKFTVLLEIDNGKGVTLILAVYPKMLALLLSQGSLPRITSALLFRSDWTFPSHAKPLGS